MDSSWAIDWQETHIEGVDCWLSGAAHSQHLNGNLKGYAAWWLWAALAGWNPCIEVPSDLTADADPGAQEIVLNWTGNSEAPDEDGFIIHRQVDGGPLPEGVYNYRVVAINANSRSNPSNEAAKKHIRLF